MTQHLNRLFRTGSGITGGTRQGPSLKNELTIQGFPKCGLGSPSHPHSLDLPPQGHPFPALEGVHNCLPNGLGPIGVLPPTPTRPGLQPDGNIQSQASLYSNSSSATNHVTLDKWFSTGGHLASQGTLGNV